MTERELKVMLDQEERRGIEQGIRLMQERILLACENGNPISINGKAYFIKSDMQNLHDIFSDLEAGAKENIKKWRVPIKKNNEALEVTIQAKTPYYAMSIAVGYFEGDGWKVDKNFNSYRRAK